jgi:outer membrane immunogenic protein
MKPILLGAAAVALAVSGAYAADLPSQKYTPEAPVVYAPAFTWTGFYVGVNAGYTWGDSGATYTYFSPTNAPLPAFPKGFLALGSDNDQSGFTGGGQAGYNFQFNQFVLGVEGDINYIGGSESKRFAAVDISGDQSFSAYNSGGVDWLGTLRARAGFAADQFLIYATGGLAFGGTDSSTSFAYFDNATFTNPSTLAWSGNSSDTGFGWTVGAGVEYAFTSNWTAKLEYLYYDLGDNTYTLTDINGAGFTANIKQEYTGNIVRAGVNYKF